MPPSPRLRRFPGRDLREDAHKRGRSLEGGLVLREKNDDLSLFNEMESRERGSFLLHSTDDFEDSLYLKPSITVPVRQGSNDLLDANGEEHDYDWLLTPPDTPLFPSLDDDTPPVNLVQRGRPRSQVIPISRSTAADKSYRTSRVSASPQRLSPSGSNRTSRGSASPQRLSPSARSNRTSRGSASPQRLSPSARSNRTSIGSASPQRLSPSARSNRTTIGSASPQRLSPSARSNRTSTFQPRGRQSSAPHSSPPPHLRTTTPLRRTSTPPNKPSTLGARSSTPTSIRINMVSDGSMASSGNRGTSPVNTSHGCSPKVLAWQSNIPGFSMDVPPNLRTSLSERPVSYVRGSSPISRKGLSSPKFGRQSMSPTAPRSPSSPYSFDRDQCSSQSKGSIASFGEDDMEIQHSTTRNISDHTVGRKVGLIPNSRALFPNNPSRTLSTTSAPKRSIDSALGQMERKGPQDMFRSLLSSVPSTGFYTGKANFTHHSMISRDFSVTTSSDASSEQGGSVALDIDGCTDPGQNDMVVERGSLTYHDAHNEVFNFDEVDEINEELGHEIIDGKASIANPDADIGNTSEVEPGLSGKNSLVNAATEMVAVISKPSYVAANLLGVDYHESTTACSKCGKKLCVIQLEEENGNICPDCSDKGECMAMASSETTVVGTQSSTTHSELTLEEFEACDVPELKNTVSELRENGSSAALLGEQAESCTVDSSLSKSILEEEQCLANPQMLAQPTVGYTQHELQKGLSSVKSCVLEGAGAAHDSTTYSELTLEEFESCDVPELKFSVSDLQENTSAAMLDEQGESCTVNSSLTKSVKSYVLEGTGATHDSPAQSKLTLKEFEFSDEPEPKIKITESVVPENTRSAAMRGKQGQRCSIKSSLPKSILEEQCLVNQQTLAHATVGPTQHELQNSHPSVKFGVSEGAGISAVLNLSSSSKWSVVQGRSFTATNIPCDDLSYARENRNSVTSTVRHNNALVASLLDLNSSKQTDIHVQQQLCDSEADIVNSQHDSNEKPHCYRSFSPGTSNHVYQASELAESSNEENEGSVGNSEYKALEESLVAEGQGRALNNTESEDENSSSIETDFVEGDELDRSESRRTSSSALASSNNTVVIQSEDTPVAKLPNTGHASSGNADEVLDDERSISDVKGPDMSSESNFTEEDSRLSNAVCGVDLVKVQICSSSVMLSGELENGHEGFPGPKSACMDSPSSGSFMDDQDPSALMTSEEASVSPLESRVSDHTNGILEESTATVRVPGTHYRSLTLEEAADTTLFCRSIIQKLAYQATNIAAEKEKSVCLEDSRPTVTVVGKAVSDRKDLRSRSGSRRSPKTQKVRNRRAETNVKTPSTMIEIDITPPVQSTPNESLEQSSVVGNKVDTKPPKLESKCNCTVM